MVTDKDNVIILYVRTLQYEEVQNEARCRVRLIGRISIAEGAVRDTFSGIIKCDLGGDRY